MPRLLPPLELIRGFEAAARHLSFTKAARELFVTQSAVSRQVQALEEHFGVDLFERSHRAIALTESGQVLFRSASAALRLLEEGALKLRAPPPLNTVTVTCTIGFAALWLIPRLSELREEHPGIDLRISADNRILEVGREQIELAIRYCPASMAAPGAVRLFGEEGFPVCSPELLRIKGRPLVVPGDLRYHVLLHMHDEENRRPTTAWPVWLEVAQLPTLKPAGSLRFSHYDQLILAAVDGQGVALGTTPLVKRLIAAGRLVAPFEQRLASPRAYYLVASEESLGRAEVRDVAKWITDKAQGD